MQGVQPLWQTELGGLWVVQGCRESRAAGTPAYDWGGGRKPTPCYLADDAMGSAAMGMIPAWRERYAFGEASNP